MTIREIITKLEGEINTLSNENKRLKKENSELKYKNIRTDNELKSLKTLLNAETVEPVNINPEVIEPEIIIEEPKKKSRRSKKSE